jgi:hypothetical protein
MTSMIQSRRTWLYAGFNTGACAVGIPYWLTPYGQVNLPSALLTPALMVVVVAAFGLVKFLVEAFSSGGR